MNQLINILIILGNKIFKIFEDYSSQGFVFISINHALNY